MNKKTKILCAIFSVAIASGIYSNKVLAAPSEIYGYKKMDLFEFHKTNYDKYGEVRYLPQDKTFSTENKNKNLINSFLEKVRTYSAIEKVDTITHASTNVNHGDGEGEVDAVSGATSAFVGVDIVFDFDMLSNALILKQLGYDIEEVDKVLEIFNTTTRTHIGKRGEIDFLVDYEDYMAKAGEAYYNDEYLSFEEYINSGKYKENRNRPYYLKYVLEDGLYGEQMQPSEVYKKSSPRVTNDLENNIKGDTISLKFKENKEWAESIELVENHMKTPLTDYVEIKNDEIKINTEIFKYGKNTISIKAKDYRTVLVSQPIYKGKVNLTVDDNHILGNDILVKGADNGYIQSLKAISVNGNDLSKDSWKVNEDNNIVISKDVFSQVGVYSIILKSEPEYIDSKLSVNVVRGNGDKVTLHEDVTENFEGNPIEIFVENYSEQWKEKIEKIKVGEQEYKVEDVNVENGKITLGSELFKGQNGKVTIKVILTDGSEYSVLQNIYKNNEGLNAPKLTSSRVELGQDIIINFDKNTNFQKSIYKIEKVYSENIPSLNTPLEFIIQDGKIVVKHNSKAFGKNGLYKLKVFATGYDPQDVIIELITNHPSFLLPAPPKVGEEFMIQVSRNSSDYNWGDNVKEVYVDGVLLQKGLHYTSDIGGVYFKAGAIKQPGEHRIKIVSTGYKDYETTLRFKDINGELGDKQTVENVNVNKNLILGEDLTITSTDKKWLEGIYEIKINDYTINKNNYRLENNSLIIHSNVVINLGENKISIKSMDYNKAEFKVNVLNDDKLLNPPILKEDVIDNTSSKEIEITFEDNEAWRDGIEYILIDGNKLSKDDVHIENGKIIISAGILTEGNHNITVPSKGYNNATLSQRISKVVPENVIPMMSKIKAGQDLTIYYGYRKEYTVEEVYINGEKIDMEKYAEKTLIGDLRLKGELFSKGGQYSIIIKSTGFVDKEFVIEVEGLNEEVEDGLKDPGNITLIETAINTNGKATIHIGFMSEYNPTKILVNGNEIDMTNDSEKNYMGTIIIKNVFTEAGEYKIVLKADGYRDKELNLPVIASKDAETKPGNDDGGNEEALKVVPERVGPITTVITDNQDFTINYAYTSEYSVEGVYVNGEKVDMGKYAQKTLIGDLRLKAELFSKGGQYSIVIKSKGFVDKEFSLEVKGSNQEIEDGSEDGSEDGLKDPGNITLIDTAINTNGKIIISIGFMSEYSPTKVLVNGNEIDMSNDYEKRYEGSIIIKNVFTEAGKYKIVLKADGYKDVEFDLTVI